jgi:DNA-binding NarL/FixJ family response regulator
VDSLLKDLSLIQVGLEILLLILLVAVLWRTRGGTEVYPEATAPESPPVLPTERLNEVIERFLSESEKISRSFEANLKDKKELSADLILKLDRRLADYRELLSRTEEAVKALEKRLAELDAEYMAPKEREGPNPAAPETRALVLKLAKKGLSVEEIAAKSRLLRGEVELIVNLEKEFSG